MVVPYSDEISPPHIKLWFLAVTELFCLHFWMLVEHLNYHFFHQNNINIEMGFQKPWFYPYSRRIRSSFFSDVAV
jgi:hypothetical protein